MHNRTHFSYTPFYRVSTAFANILRLINAADADSPDDSTGRIFMHGPRHKLTFQLGEIESRRGGGVAVGGIVTPHTLPAASPSLAAALNLSPICVHCANILCDGSGGNLVASGAPLWLIKFY